MIANDHSNEHQHTIGRRVGVDVFKPILNKGKEERVIFVESIHFSLSKSKGHTELTNQTQRTSNRNWNPGSTS